MKRILLIASLAFAVLSASAQEKEAKTFTHQKGDIALGIDATPFLEYAGNAFNTSFNGAPYFGGTTIFGKYFLTEKSAVRVMLKLNFNSETDKQLVNDVTSTATPPAQVENSQSYTQSNIALGVGYELRRGEGRLQAFYGGGILLSTNNGDGSVSYKYGNNITQTYPVSRTTEIKNGASIGFGANGFVGVEYFLSSNISLGGQVSLALEFQTAAKGKVTTESWDSANNNVKTQSVEQYTSPSGFGLNTAGSGIFMSFYF